MSTSNFAEVLWAQDDLAGACALHERVLEARRRVLGQDHPDTLMSMNSFAESLSAQDDLARARALHEQVLEARHRVLGEEHPSTTVSAWNLVATLLREGNEAAVRIMEERLAWLLAADVERLAPEQRTVRGYLEQLLLSQATSR